MEFLSKTEMTPQRCEMSGTKEITYLWIMIDRDRDREVHMGGYLTGIT